MKRAAFVFALVLIFCFAGCANTNEQVTNPMPNAGIQAAYDKSREAEEYAGKLLEEMLSQKGIAEYDVELTSGGFITDNPIVYIVGYRYTYRNVTEVYGYKLSDDFSILDEGTEVGEFILG